MARTKRELGQYFTEYNPFENDGFLSWANECDLENSIVLEPFAGSNNLVNMLKKMKLCSRFVSYDIEPKSKNIIKQDTLSHFPRGFEVCITNPPYLAQNSAKRRKIYFPNIIYDDLYKYALEKCLANTKYVAAIIPASFLNSNLFRDRLSHYILLNSKIFIDTDHPVCLALFKPHSDDVDIYYNSIYIDKLSILEKKIPQISLDKNTIKFNIPNGELGLIAIDNTIEPSIKFIYGEEIDSKRVMISSRSITRISLNKNYNLDKLIKILNKKLNIFRNSTYDIFLTPFKGLRKDNMYRRRLDYKLARSIISEALTEL